MLRADVLTLAGWIRRAHSSLEEARCPSPRHEAERLAANALGLRWGELWTRMREPLQPSMVDRLEASLTRRVDGQPLAYITGSAVFYGIELECGPGVLVPRPETEVLVDVALELIGDRKAPIVVDIGTGTGAIAAALTSKRTDARTWATDVSPAALRYAARNLEDVTIVLGDLFDALPGALSGRIDLVVSNPPYIADDADLPAEVRAEPREAVRAGPRGDEVLRRIVTEAPGWLSARGAVALEVGTDEQAQTLLCELETFASSGVRNDHNGLPRVVWARI